MVSWRSPRKIARVSRLVLIVEDNIDLVATLDYNLSKAGYETASARCGREALDMAQQRCPDALVLDLGLPDISGFDVCRELRRGSDAADTPILILSARDEEVDRVVAFELGVDDYMSKPFSIRELLLRVDGLIRRAALPSGGKATPGRLQIGAVAIDVHRRCGFVDEAEVELTRLEFDLLHTLMERCERVQTRSRLLIDVWQQTTEDDGGGRTVDTHIKRLRKKLGSAGGMIRTVRGVGYCFSEAH